MSTFLHRAAAVLLLVGLSGVVCAQSFTENFDNVTTLPGAGWVIQNNSSPIGANSWFQGTNIAAAGPFDAYNGAANAYIGVNYASTAGSTGTISNWLIAPNRTLRNGDVFYFHTRKVAPDTYADRLEFRLSTNGASTNVGATATGTGDFTTLLLSINPSLVTGVYPVAWTQYTVTISGLPAPTSGRAAFRYFVTAAGPTGTNSDYIGIDNVGYTPYVCPAFTMTAGGALSGGTWGQGYGFTLVQTGALGAPGFAVTAGALPPGLALASDGSISGTASATGTFNFSVTVSDASGCSGSQSYSITVGADLPGAPQDVGATASDAQISVSWTAPASDGGDSITGYIATCSDGEDEVSASGLASPITVAGLDNGTAYTCSVTASNGIGEGPASADSNSATPMGNQTITFDEQPGQTYSPGVLFSIDPLASASSGLQVVYASTTTDVCTVADATVSVVSAGTCTLTADQPGDSVWNAAPQVVQSLLIAQASQELSFPTQIQASRWFDAGRTFAIDPEASSADPNSGTSIVYSSVDPGVCSVIGTTVTMVAEGSCTIAADQAGDANYSAAVQVTTTVLLIEPTEADLWIEKTADRDTARIGDTVVYTIIVGNLGPADAIDVGVIDPSPERLDPASVVWACLEAIGAVCPDPDADAGDLAVTIESLPEGASLRFEFSGTVMAAADPGDDFTAFDNTAHIALPPGSSLTDPAGNNEDTATVLVIPEAIFEDGFEAAPPK